LGREKEGGNWGKGREIKGPGEKKGQRGGREEEGKGKRKKGKGRGGFCAVVIFS